MTTSLTPSLVELVEEGKRIPEETLVFLRERLQTMMHQLVLREFLRQSKTRGLKKIDLAKKLGRENQPELISRWIGRPGNRTVDTVSDLLAAMGVIPMRIDVARAADLVAAETAASAAQDTARESADDDEEQDVPEDTDEQQSASTEPYPNRGELRIDHSEHVTVA